MNRREFLKCAGFAAGAAALSPAGAADVAGAKEPGALLASEPMLQNPAETTMDVVFAVSDLAGGFVDVSESADFASPRRFLSGDVRQMKLDDQVAQVRLSGLKPATRYYYRIGAKRIARERKGSGVDYRAVLGEETGSRTYSFVTSGAGAESHFAFLTDTHEAWDTIARYHERLAARKVPLLIWNGDACNCADTVERLVEVYLKPKAGRADYAAEMPVCLNPGNHEYRGLVNRELERVFAFRDPAERSVRDVQLGRNYAIRQGDIAIIGLDTADSRGDGDPRTGGLQRSASYREAQTAWLADALKRPEIASAPYLVATCHIPLYSHQANSNPGDVTVEEAKGRYRSDEAYWLRPCYRTWGKLLTEAKAQIVLTGHIHYYQWYGADQDRSWAQVIGGGRHVHATKRMPVKGGVRAENYNPTFIEGSVKDGKLSITVFNLGLDAYVDEFVFSPRA